MNPIQSRAAYELIASFQYVTPISVYCFITDMNQHPNFIYYLHDHERLEDRVEFDVRMIKVEGETPVRYTVILHDLGIVRTIEAPTPEQFIDFLRDLRKECEYGYRT